MLAQQQYEMLDYVVKNYLYALLIQEYGINNKIWYWNIRLMYSTCSLMFMLCSSC